MVWNRLIRRKRSLDPYADRGHGDVSATTCGSIARALPAVLAPLIIAELHADAAWVGIYFSLTAFAGLIGQLGSGTVVVGRPAGPFGALGR